MSRLVSTLDAAVAVGRTPAVVRDWARKGMVRTYGAGRSRMFDLREVQAVHERLLSVKVAGRNRRILALLRDTRPADLDGGVDSADTGVLIVVPRVPDDLDVRAGDYAIHGPATIPDDRPGLSSS